MENWMKYCLSLALILSALFFIKTSDRLSNETYRELDINDRRKLSADYLALAKSLEMGSPKAMRLLDKAARINPENELVWKELSWPYLYSGDYKKWSEYIDKAISLNPQEWQGNRGYIKLSFFKDYGGALYDIEAHDTIKTEISFRGRVYATSYLKGLCYLGLENYELASSSFLSYLESIENKQGSFEVNPMANIYLGIIENYHQNYDEALNYLNPAMQEEKPLADSHYHAAYANFMLGKNELANEQVESALQLFDTGKYNQERMVEVQYQLYHRNIERLAQDIACFL